MAYIPDELVMGSLNIAPSAARVLFYYCGRANQDTGETSVSAQRVSQDLGIRKDHVDEQDRKLVREGLIEIVKDDAGRLVRLLSPWRSRAERGGRSTQSLVKKVASQVLGESADMNTQNLGSSLDSSPNLGELPQVLGESPQNLGKSPQILGAHIGITSPWNQPMEPAHEPTLGATAPDWSVGRSETKVRERRKMSSRKASLPKSQFHKHPSVVAYREILGFNAINAAQADLIAKVTGAEVERASPEWLRFLRELAETGNKHAHNVRVMVLAFRRYSENVSLAESLDLAWSEVKGRKAPARGDADATNQSGDSQKDGWERAAERIKAREVI